MKKKKGAKDGIVGTDSWVSGGSGRKKGTRSLVVRLIFLARLAIE